MRCSLEDSLRCSNPCNPKASEPGDAATSNPLTLRNQSPTMLAMTGHAVTAKSRIETSLHDGPVALTEFAWNTLPNCGAEAAFLGRTRAETHPQFGPLRQLDYEVYEPMTLRLLEQLARQAAEQWQCAAVRLVHARGSVAVGQASVVIQTAAPHRAQALDACRWLIERVKHDLPIWKHEIWERGQTFAPGIPGTAGSVTEP